MTLVRLLLACVRDMVRPRMPGWRAPSLAGDHMGWGYGSCKAWEGSRRLAVDHILSRGQVESGAEGN
jgi:hypothetical protein